MILKNYTTAELVEEISKRALELETNEIKRWCDDCGNFVSKSDADDKYNPCRKMHKMNFKMPEQIDDEFGYYRIICSDRTDR